MKILLREEQYSKLKEHLLCEDIKEIEDFYNIMNETLFDIFYSVKNKKEVFLT